MGILKLFMVLCHTKVNNLPHMPLQATLSIVGHKEKFYEEEREFSSKM